MIRRPVLLTHVLLTQVLLAAVTLAGCTGSARPGYPSLTPRAIERGGFEEPSAPPEAQARPDPALDARIASLVAAATTRGKAFATARTRAETRVTAAARAPAGSPAWLDAQVALGDLDVLRAEAGEDATTLEEIAADRAVAGEPPYPALDAAAAESRARAAEIVAAAAALGARLTR